MKPTFSSTRLLAVISLLDNVNGMTLHRATLHRISISSTVSVSPAHWLIHLNRTAFGDAKTPPSRGVYGAKYTANCIRITTPQMNAVTQQEFGDSLSRCTVRIYRFLDFNDSLFPKLDSSHVFLEAEHDSVVYFGRKSQHYKLWRKTVVVDACTGVVVFRSSMYFRLKNYKEGWPAPCVRQ